MRLFILALFCCSFLPIKAETIKIAAIDWCPQICPNDSKPGYVVDLVKEMFRDSGYQLEINYYPWSRAIKLVLSGQADALLSPAKAEAPSLIYPNNEVGVQRMCFFTEQDSKWQYRGTKSLAGLQIGIATDTSIEELNSYVADNLMQFQFQPYHERYIVQNAKKLQKNRIDAFLFTRNSTVFELNKAGIWHQFKEAGCVSNAKIYMAFSPVASLKDKVSKLIKLFDHKMEAINGSFYKEELMHQYGLDK